MREHTLRQRYGRAETKAPPPCPRPFSAPGYAPGYHKRADRVSMPDWPCALCGKAVKTEDAKWATVVEGGARFELTTDTPIPEDDPGHMGSHAVGPDCAKKLARCGARLTRMEAV